MERLPGFGVPHVAFVQWDGEKDSLHVAKLVDVFHAPGFFTSIFAYEREQKWPFGHRNMVFAQRGGPIVYIQRKNYLASPWQKLFPVKENGEAELHPAELWDVLTRFGKPVTAISHTGATGMGTDWDQIPPIDHRVENVIEIYQGARVSYEAPGAPQPTVGLREGEKYNHSSDVVGVPVVGEPIRSFTVKNNGVYQHALEIGHKLGVWANSDHISTHTSYGGVYVKEFTREGIIEASTPAAPSPPRTRFSSSSPATTNSSAPRSL